MVDKIMDRRKDNGRRVLDDIRRICEGTFVDFIYCDSTVPAVDGVDFLMKAIQSTASPKTDMKQPAVSPSEWL